MAFRLLVASPSPDPAEIRDLQHLSPTALPPSAPFVRSEIYHIGVLFIKKNKAVYRGKMLMVEVLIARSMPEGLFLRSRLGFLLITVSIYRLVTVVYVPHTLP